VFGSSVALCVRAGFRGAVRALSSGPVVRTRVGDARSLGAAASCVALLALLAAAGPATATVGWSAAPDMSIARDGHTATLLASGKVLVTGGATGSGVTASAELYDPASNTWSTAPSMSSARSSHTATLLAGGRVLVIGGAGTGGGASAELYDPASNTWSTAPSMSSARSSHTATLLANGKVLVIGGSTNPITGVAASPELYDPGSNTWSVAPDGSYHGDGPSATLLADGKVLVAGGYFEKSYSSAAELYDPVRNTWSATASMNSVRGPNTATRLADGKVLVSGGNGFYSNTVSAELYDPASNTWSPAPSMRTARFVPTTTLLFDGKVLMAGGITRYSLSMPDGSTMSGPSTTASAELYDPASNAWSAAPSMSSARDLHTATRLASGKVLVTGGYTGTAVTASAELYGPIPKLSGAPAPPPTAKPWTLTRTTKARLTQRRGAMRVSSGFVAGCPAGGPACRGRLTLKLRRRSPTTGRMIEVSLTRRVAVTTIEAATKRPVTFRLSPSGARRLRRLHRVTAILRGSLRTGGGAAIVRRATLRLTAPPRH
jgi:N-acetylneuraminic acid mutarotase